MKAFRAVCETWFATIAVVALSVTAPHEASAALAGDVASVAADEHALAATRTVHKLAATERHDLVLPSNTVVHEYLSNGVVFAITWQGPAIPDLRTLLGSYFSQLKPRASGGSHHSMHLVGNDFVVRAMGHGRSHTGQAWVPSLVPSGFNIDAVE